jgi:hypothetical protein
MKVGWDNYFDLEVGRDKFPDFVRAVLKRNRGWVSLMYNCFVGPKDAPYLDFVGKQENLSLDLLWALRLAGQEVDEKIILQHEKVNVVSTLPEWRSKCMYTPELEHEVRIAEKEAMQRFGYW